MFREQYILVTGSHGRLMYREYKGTYEAVKQQLADAGMLIDGN